MFIFSKWECKNICLPSKMWIGRVFFARGISSPGQNWRWTLLGREIHTANGKAQACTQGTLLFFLLSFWGRGREGEGFFFIFPWFPMCSHYVPFNFLMGFHQVLNMFLKFPTCSPTCPPQHLTFIPYVLANVVLLSPILGGPKARISILQNRTFSFTESP